MKLPFTSRQFFDLFGQYNLTVYPIPVVFVLLAILSLYLVISRNIFAGRIVAGILATFWFWMGVVYHLSFFTSINGAAFIFGGLFILQSLFFIWYAMHNPISISFQRNVYTITASIFIIYSLVLYPVAGYFAGHHYPYLPTFGVPCPTTIFTLGILLLVNDRLPVYLLIIPVLWSLIGFSAAFILQVYEDIGLILASMIFIILQAKRNRKHNVHLFTGSHKWKTY